MKTQERYTQTVIYIPPTPMTNGKRLSFMPRNSSVVNRHLDIFSEEHYMDPQIPLEVGSFDFYDNAFEANVLRLLIKENDSVILHLPKELEPLKGFIEICLMDYYQRFPDLFSNFLYLTVRTASETNFYKNSGTWHVDGFQGARIKRHRPEINYLWSNSFPTEFLLERFSLAGFDYKKYNVNSYFRDFAKGRPEDVFKCEENFIYIMDPYMVHRSPICDFNGKKRIFIRLNMSPVEIADHTNTINPMLPRIYENRVDVRDTLSDFKD